MYRLPKYNTGAVSWSYQLNGHIAQYMGSNDYVLLDYKTDPTNPPKILQYTSYDIWAEEPNTIPNGVNTDDNEIVSGATINNRTCYTIREPSNVEFVWSTGGVPASSAGTWYIYSTGVKNTDTSTLGKSNYRFSPNDI